MLGVSLVAHADPDPKIDLQLEPTQGLQVGDVLRAHLSMPPGSDSMPAVLQVDTEKKDQQGIKAGFLIRSQPDASGNFVIAVVKSGEVQIPALLVKDESGKILARTEAMTLSVQSAKKDDQDNEPVPARGLVSIKFPVLWATGASLGFLLLLALLVWWWKARKNRAVVPLPVQQPLLSALDQALRDLDALEAKKLPDHGHHKLHYFSVSDILKEFISRRFQINAVESTTSEMLTALRSERVHDGWCADLQLLFQALDWFKFTDHIPTSSQASEALTQAREWIKRAGN